MTGAIFSHMATGDAVAELIPSSLLLILTVISWYFRPLNRKIPAFTGGEISVTSISEINLNKNVQ
jgi:hypothetical protein